jgi:hypothetical protein
MTTMTSYQIRKETIDDHCADMGTWENMRARVR